jgi:hypothetical protein
VEVTKVSDPHALKLTGPGRELTSASRVPGRHELDLERAQ